MWWFLAVGVALQLYFVRELLAAFALFAAIFAVIGLFIAALYMRQKAWKLVSRDSPTARARPPAWRAAPLRPWKNWAAARFAARFMSIEFIEQFSGFSQNTTE